MIHLLAQANPPLPTEAPTSVAAVLLLVIVLLLTGWLYTRGAYLELRQDRDAWRAAYDKEHLARLDAERTAKAALEGVGAMNQILGEIRAEQLRQRAKDGAS